MQYPSVFAATLGLSEPWQLSSVSFAKVEDRMDITVDFSGDCMFACPHCSDEETICYTEWETWFHEDFFRHHTYLHVRVPHTACCICEKFPSDRPWCRPGSRFILVGRNPV